MPVYEGSFEEEKRSAIEYLRWWRAKNMNTRTKSTQPVGLQALQAVERELARTLPVSPRPPEEFLPPIEREEPMEEPIERVTTFGALPTREIDDIITAIDAEIVALKEEAQAVRDLYSRRTARITNDIKQLQVMVKLGKDILKSWRDQCNADAPPTPKRLSKRDEPKADED